MAEIRNEFQFTTKSIPQAGGQDGARWENIPIASMPPSLDISIPDSFGNGVAAAVSGFAEQFKGLKGSLEALTQGVQDSACSLQGLIDNLKFAQDFMDQTAKNNNNTTVYVRLIGVDPVGTITTTSEFNRQVREIISDTANSPTDVGKLPKVVPAEIPISPTVIANALGSGESTLERALTLPGSLQGRLPGGVSVGLNLRTLSNDDDWRNGFDGSEAQYEATRISPAGTQTDIVLNIPDASGIGGGVITIENATNAENNGTFGIASVKSNSGLFENAGGNKTITVRFNNQDTSGIVHSTVEEGNTNALVSFPSNSTRVSAATLVQQALQEQGFYGDPSGATQLDRPRDADGNAIPNSTVSQKHTIPVTTLVDILANKSLIGPNPELASEDRDIALERLTKLTTGQSTRVGGMVFSGRAANLGSLARKVQSLSTVMDWLEPLAERLAFTALSEFDPNASGVEFNTDEIDLSKLTPANNVGKKDIEAVKKKAADSGVLSHEPIPTEVVEPTENPPPTEFQAWRKFKPVQLIPGMAAFGSLNDAAESAIGSGVSTGLKNTVGWVGDKLTEATDGITTGLNFLESQGRAIDSIANSMNGLSEQIAEGTNWLKNQVGAGTVQLDGHLIGPKLNLQSNEDFIKATEAAVNDITDPNRPTFGAQAGTSIIASQNALNQTPGAPPKSTTMWFGMVIFIVGKDKRALGDQMNTMAELLSMDTDAIAHKKKKISWKL